MRHGGLQEIIDTQQCPSVQGTRDNFGIKNEFYDPKTKQYIDTRKKWHDAGFRNPLVDGSQDKRHNSDHMKQLKDEMKKKKSEGKFNV